jgi:hypothetical protein
MKEVNKGIRLESVCAPVATEVVSSNIRLEIRYGVATSYPCPNHDFLDYEDAHDFNPVNPVNHINHGSDNKTHDGNPSGLSRSVEDARPFHPASRRGCNPDGMQRPVVAYRSTERRIPCRMQAGDGKRHHKMDN